MAEPYPKSRQLARGERRYRRKIASPKQWQALHSEKLGECRCASLGNCLPPMHLHHLVPRDRFGDDVADNLVPLCGVHHSLIHLLGGPEATLLLESLTDAEYAYMIQRGGEDYPERAYGIRYTR